MQDYNMLIYFQTAFSSGGGDKFASPYMAFQKPLLVTILETITLKVSNQIIIAMESLRIIN
tara:strand:- start:400 stop:582 length:183 start_codon:yes stop_codon:yes gene_type:complete